MQYNWWMIGGIAFACFLVIKVFSVRVFLRWWKQRNTTNQPHITDD